MSPHPRRCCVSSKASSASVPGGQAVRSSRAKRSARSTCHFWTWSGRAARSGPWQIRTAFASALALPCPRRCGNRSGLPRSCTLVKVPPESQPHHVRPNDVSGTSGQPGSGRVAATAGPMVRVGSVGWSSCARSATILECGGRAVGRGGAAGKAWSRWPRTRRPQATRSGGSRGPAARGQWRPARGADAGMARRDLPQRPRRGLAGRSGRPARPAQSPRSGDAHRQARNESIAGNLAARCTLRRRGQHRCACRGRHRHSQCHVRRQGQHRRAPRRRRQCR